MKVDELSDYELFVLIMAGAEEIDGVMTADWPLAEVAAEAKKVVDRLSELLAAYQAKVAAGATIQKIRPRLVTDRVQ